MKPLLVIFATFILSACTSAVSTATLPTVVPTFTAASTSTVIPLDEAFVNEVYHRLDVDDTIPDAGRQATISLFMNRPTALFPDNQGLVLVYDGHVEQ